MCRHWAAAMSGVQAMGFLSAGIGVFWVVAMGFSSVGIGVFCGRGIGVFVGRGIGAGRAECASASGFFPGKNLELRKKG